MFFAAVLTGLFMGAEVVGGIYSGSLALLADAGHMLTDFAALVLAWVAFRMARRPADLKRTFGAERVQILVAFVNGLTLFFIALLIVKEAVTRFMHPVSIEAPLMTGVAAAGLVVNIVVFLILHGGDKQNLNVRGATLHVLGDLLGSVAALVAGGVIMATGKTVVDPILSVFVALILLRSAWYVTREAGHILLENAPANLSLDDIRDDLMKHIDKIEDIHHLHAWSITQSRPIVTMHIKVAKRVAPEEITCLVKQRLYEVFGVDHATIEIEYELCSDDMMPGLAEQGVPVPPSHCNT